MSLNTYNISYLHKTRPYGKTLPGSHRNEEIRGKKDMEAIILDNNSPRVKSHSWKGGKIKWGHILVSKNNPPLHNWYKCLLILSKKPLYFKSNNMTICLSFHVYLQIMKIKGLLVTYALSRYTCIDIKTCLIFLAF